MLLLLALAIGVLICLACPAFVVVLIGAVILLGLVELGAR